MEPSSTLHQIFSVLSCSRRKKIIKPIYACVAEFSRYECGFGDPFEPYKHKEQRKEQYCRRRADDCAVRAEDFDGNDSKKKTTLKDPFGSNYLVVEPSVGTIDRARGANR